MYCQKCGCEIKPDQKFCSNCGEAVLQKQIPKQKLTFTGKAITIAGGVCLLLIIFAAIKLMGKSDEERIISNEKGLNDFAEIVQGIGSQQDKIKESSQIQIINFLPNGTFWGIETDETGAAYIVHADVHGNVMNRVPYSNMEKEMRYGIGDNLVIWKNEYPICVYNINTNEDVTASFVGDYDEIYDLLENDDDIVLVVRKTIDTFEEKYDCVKLVDTAGNILIELSLDRNTLLAEYGMEKNTQEGPEIKWVGEKVFYMPYIGDEHADREYDSLIIDLARNKVIPVDAPDDNCTGYCCSDGDYTIIYESYRYMAMVNHETDEFTVMDSGYVPSVAMDLGREAERLSEGKYPVVDRYDGLFYVLDIQGNKVIDLNNYGQDVVKMYPFTEGAALIEFENGYVTFIDSNGGFLFDPIKGVVANFYKDLCAAIIVDYNNGEVFLLDKEGGKQTLNIFNPGNVFYTEFEGKAYLVEGEGWGLNAIEMK